MRYPALFTLLIGTICLTGCFHLDTAYVRQTGEEHVHLSNDGWYLFHVLPLACGNISTNRTLPFVLFRDDVTMNKIQNRFFDYSEAAHKQVYDPNYLTTESVLLEIPGLDLPIPLPYILTKRRIQLSGVLK